jgi:hypothetical protein
MLTYRGDVRLGLPHLLRRGDVERVLWTAERIIDLI